MNRQQLILLYVISAAAVVACFFLKPVSQDPNYHNFADTRTLLSIPNFWNVVSNLPFVIIGVLGLMKLRQVSSKLNPSYVWFFTGIALTGIGSTYYHWHPDNGTLVWDRLPMTVSFMSFLSIVIGEFIHADSGKKILHPLLAVGLASIVSWIQTDDLRMYALVQFLPIILILIILFLSKKHPKSKKYFWLIVVFYAIAKFLESYDSYIYGITQQTIGGHALKHFAAALAPLTLYRFAKSNTEN